MKPDTFDTLLSEIEQGATLKAAIATAKTSWRSLQLLIEKDDKAASRYARARMTSAMFWADKAVETVDAAHNIESATIARVRQDVYRWRAKVANPREYGDRVDVQAEVRHTVTGVIALPLEDTVALPSHATQAPRALPLGDYVDATITEPTHHEEGGRGGDGSGDGGA